MKSICHHVADFYAKAGAAQHEMKPEVVTSVFEVDQAAWAVQKRIKTVNVRCAELDGSRRQEKAPKNRHTRKENKPKVLEAAGHTIKSARANVICPTFIKLEC